MAENRFEFDRLEQIISLAQKIKETRNQLGLLIEEWNNKFPGVTLQDPTFLSHPISSPVEPQPIVNSIDERIVQHLDANVDRDFNANMLHDELGVPPSSLGTQLSKLFRSNKIGRSGRGYYHSIERTKLAEIFDTNEKEATEVTS